MTLHEFLDSNWFQLGIFPIFIFLARIVDVSIGTVRIIFVSRGLKFKAAVLGFFEVLVWIMVISTILRNLTHPINYIAYAAGFATGNYVGILLEQKLSIGKVILRIITSGDTEDLRKYLSANGIRFTVLDAFGGSGAEQKILFTILDRKKLPEIIKNITLLNPTAFYSIEDVRQVREGEFPSSFRPVTTQRPFSRQRIYRIIKGK